MLEHLLSCRLKTESPESSLFQLEFTLDAECPCFVQVHFNAREFYQDGEMKFKPTQFSLLRYTSYSFSYTNKKTSTDRPNYSQRFHFDMGCDQLFNNYVFDLAKWDLSEVCVSFNINSLPSVLSFNIAEDFIFP